MNRWLYSIMWNWNWSCQSLLLIVHLQVNLKLLYDTWNSLHFIHWTFSLFTSLVYRIQIVLSITYL
jgi:hypothetical protein